MATECATGTAFSDAVIIRLAKPEDAHVCGIICQACVGCWSLNPGCA
jgi:hypothetical protein